MKQIINNTQMINNRLETIFESLNAQTVRGEIKSETEMLHKLFIALRSFYESVGKPSFEFKEAMATPVSKDYNGMILEFIEDTTFLLEDCDKIAESLTKAFTSIELDREMMKNQMRYIFKKINIMKENPTIDNGAIVSDSFTSADIFDKSKCTATPADINAIEGIITLARTTSNNLTQEMSVSIGSESTGFPGNSHIVAATGAAVRFEGEDGLNNDPASINDEQLDTWYEMELFKLTGDTYDKIEGYGVTYKENSMWITEEGKMAMHLELELENAKEANWISLSPFIPEHRGAAPAVIKSIVIDDNKGSVQTVVTDDVVFDDDIILVFERQNFKYIRILIEQTIPYNIDIGHVNYFEMNNQNRSLFDNGDGYINRIEGPLPTVKSLGMTYDPRKHQLIHPSTKRDSMVAGEKSKKELFDIQEVDDNVVGVVDIIDAKRFQVGIRNINVYNNEFELESEFISTPFQFTKPLKEISLDVSDVIPLGFDEDALEYFISIDEGEMWHQIQPIDRAFKGKGKYIFNESLPAGAREANIGYIDSKRDVYSVRLRIKLNRPADQLAYTPIVKDFSMTVKFGGVGNEY